MQTGSIKADFFLDDYKQVLDHGYVKLVDSWGSDEAIIEAARMSTSKGFQGWGSICDVCKGNGIGAIDNGMVCACSSCEGLGKSVGDEKLLRYLWEHKHYSPFEMGGLVVEVQAPIFVFREWHRHRTQSYNELSARYTELPDLFYIPSLERLRAGKQGVKNKQGSEEGLLPVQAEYARDIIRYATSASRNYYEDLLKQGVSREIARLVIPVNQYSRMRASANLRNWLAFLTLRLDKGAQWEIRQYAETVSQIVRELFPRTHELFITSS